MTDPLFSSPSELIKQQREHREELRRDIETYVEPDIRAAHDADKFAIELGQSILKTGTLLNGGAIVAIPAIVTLFGIDAKAIMTSLLIAGGLFVFGLISSWLAGCWEFFALALRSDRDYSRGEAAKQGLHRDYYPSDNGAKKAAHETIINILNVQADHNHKAFVIFRLLAIGFSFLSLATFVAGNAVGGWAVLHAPSKPVAVVQPPIPTKP